MSDFFDSIVRNTYWLIPVTFVIYIFYKTAKNYQSHNADYYIKLINKIHLGGIEIAFINLEDYPHLNSQYYYTVTSQLTSHGFKHLADICHVTGKRSISRPKNIFRTMRNETGTITATITSNHLLTKNNKGELHNFTLETLLSDNTIITTHALDNYLIPLNWGCKIINSYPGLSSIDELIKSHLKSIANYTQDKPEVKAVPILTDNDLVSAINIEIKLKKNSLLEKGCLITWEDLQILFAGEPVEQLRKKWPTYIERQKKLGFWYEKSASTQSDTQTEETCLLTQTEPLIYDNTPPQTPFNSDMSNNTHPELRRNLQEALLRKNHPAKALLFLLISLVLFFNLGWFNWGLDFVINLLIVLFVHETGHYLAMKLSGYKNLQMFFIPFIGAAVSGQSHNVKTWKKVAVSLAGPLPGIIIGIAMIWLSFTYNSDKLNQIGILFLIINGFNLLPLLPLDGGWVINHTLYSRVPFCEIIMRVIAFCLFMILAMRTDDFIIYILAFFNFTGIQAAWHNWRFIQTFRQQYHDLIPENENCTDNSITIPDLALELINNHLRDKRKIKQDKVLAQCTLDIWEKITSKPTSMFATLFSWLILFVIGYGGLAFGLALSMDMFQQKFINSYLVSENNADGKTYIKEVVYGYGNKNFIIKETELSPDGNLYHGTCKMFNRGKIAATANWNNGFLDGNMEILQDNMPHEILFFQNGHLISGKIKDGFEWKPMTDLEKYQKMDKDVPCGPINHSEVVDIKNSPTDSK